MQKVKRSAILALVMMIVLALPVSAASSSFPDIITLPVGFRPEGIAVGHGSTFFTGSLADGTVLRGDLRTGEYDVLVTGQAGMLSVGMAYEERSNALFVAGGPTGLLRVFDADSGDLLQIYSLAGAGSSFINDVIVTREAAYVTNSFAPVLYRIPFGPGGALPDPGDVEVIPLSGDWVQVAGQFNANGIEATPNGKWLVVVNSTLGTLYRVDPETGVATEIDLGGQSVQFGDGLLFRGSYLYVVRNQLNEIVVIDLSADLTAGTTVEVITDADVGGVFTVPTTAAAFGNAIYVVNAKFGNPTPNDIPYEIVRVELH